MLAKGLDLQPLFAHQATIYRVPSGKMLQLSLSARCSCDDLGDNMSNRMDKYRFDTYEDGSNSSEHSRAGSMSRGFEEGLQSFILAAIP